MLKAGDNKCFFGALAQAQRSRILVLFNPLRRVWSVPKIRGPEERKLCNNSNGKCVTISAPSFSQVSEIIDFIKEFHAHRPLQ